MIFEEIGSLFVNVAALSDWRYWVMWAIGGTLIYLAIKKDMEPSLLLPMGFGAILVNLPLSGAIDQMHELGIEVGALSELFRAGISNELFPLLLFIGSIIMICMGISGIYIAKIYEEVKGRPRYIIADTVRGDADDR